MRRRSLAGFIACLAAATGATSFINRRDAHAQGNCSPPLSNAIVCENVLTGNPASEWDISGIGDPSIQGFATDISVNRGQTVNFKINTNSANYHLDIYRLGYYGGFGARKVATVQPSASLPQTQPACLRDPSTGLVDCGNWAPSAAWAVPAAATSGVYVAKLVRVDTGGASHIVFIVRDDAGHSDLLVQTSDLRWQAYNNYGGNSLYEGTGPAPDGRAYKVSYNRPFNTRGTNGNAERQGFLFGSEYPMIRFLEANGYDVSYAAGVDTDRRGAAALQQHKVFMSVGHDEYWSGQQRANVEAARDAGINLAFFSGDEIFWKTRWENSIDGTGTAYRTLVCYKETHANAKIDPTPAWTGTWRDPRYSPPADGGRPENALSGQMFSVFNPRNDPISISSAEGKLRFWRNTGLDTLLPGQSAQLPAGVLGYEWDEVYDNGLTPPGQVRLSTTTVAVSAYLRDYGSTWGPGTPTHHLTIYRHSSGALVFGAGSVQWAWGLDATHDLPGTPADARMRQATVNLFADMGVQPVTLQPGLVPAIASLDLVAPTSTILTPLGGTVPACTPLTITGTAVDAGGGIPAAVEFSVDGGTTWHAAAGGANWVATWTPIWPGPVTIKSRAVDDSGRLESPGPGVAVTVGPSSCVYSLWTPQTTPATIDSGVSQPVELGVRFLADGPGFINALRFYKAPADTGTHVGNLWKSDGTLLATVPFTGETASGWQEAPLPTPIPITANTTYIASYHTDTGHFSINVGNFASFGVDRPPLHAPATTSAQPNGVYVFGASAFPNFDGVANNYWVDVVYAPRGQVATPVFTPVAGTYVGPVSVTLSDATPGAQIYYTTNGTTPTPSSTLCTGPIAVTVTTTIKAIAVAGGMTNSPVASATYTPQATCSLCSLWPPQTTPATLDSGVSQPVELGVRFQADGPGFIKALRFYKAPANTGSHVGNLWRSDGTLLATVPFTGETPSGWQEATLSTPIPIAANTNYVASYHTDTGHFSIDVGSFATAGVDRPPLHAPATTPAQPNAVYVFGASAFPSLDGLANNYWVDVVYQGIVATPAFSPAAGTYQASVSATLTDATTGAQMYYTTNGSTPTASSTPYTGPIAVTVTTMIQAIAVVSGWVNSAVASATYTLKAPPPTFIPIAGIYSGPQSVTLSSTIPGARIYYTTNGSTPTTSSTRYTVPIAITTTTTIKAIVAVTGWTNSAVASARYTIQGS